MITKDELRTRLFAHIRKSNTMPDFWGGYGYGICIDGIVNMIACGKYTDKQIQKQYGADRYTITAVKILYNKKIQKVSMEYKRLNRGCSNHELDDDACLRLMAAILFRNKEEEV